MKLAELFKRSLEELHASGCQFAVGGGFAADLYRKQPRGTGDIDFLFFIEGSVSSIGRTILANLGLAAGEVRLHQLTRSPRMNKKSQELYILVGRTSNEENPGVDLLLSPFPWFEKALARAQHHLVDFGFGPTPTLTVEDVILAKLFANRHKDIDDVISIFESKCLLDLSYLAGEMERLGFYLPEATIKDAPIALRALSKRKRRKHKSFP